MIRQTRIICTIGPASESEKMLRSLMRAGMDVARINFSHSDQSHHRAVIRRIRTVARQENRPIAVLADLQGPKIRIDTFRDGPVTLRRGASFTLTTRAIAGTVEGVTTKYRSLPQDVQPGAMILLDDGRIQLQVKQITGKDIRCVVREGGRLSDHKGMNLPDSAISAPSLTPKDRADLKFALQVGIDYVALSFVRRPEDVRMLRRILRRSNAGDVPIIAKLEKPQAIDALEGILDVADCVMVARGDLGVEMPLSGVPLIQKRIIREANRCGKLVITATEMLDSMIDRPRPTRAEASDVANAILDDTDAVMLSAETATGQYPVKAVEYMARIIQSTEENREHPLMYMRAEKRQYNYPETISLSAARAAKLVDARAIIALTHTGSSARLISKTRPVIPVYGVTHKEHVRNRMSLYWGVIPVIMPYVKDRKQVLRMVCATLKKKRLIRKGDSVIVMMGSDVSKQGATNMMLIHHVE